MMAEGQAQPVVRLIDIREEQNVPIQSVKVIWYFALSVHVHVCKIRTSFKNLFAVVRLIIFQVGSLVCKYYFQ